MLPKEGGGGGGGNDEEVTVYFWGLLFVYLKEYLEKRYVESEGADQWSSLTHTRVAPGQAVRGQLTFDATRARDAVSWRVAFQHVLEVFKPAYDLVVVFSLDPNLQFAIPLYPNELETVPRPSEHSIHVLTRDCTPDYFYYLAALQNELEKIRMTRGETAGIHHTILQGGYNMWADSPFAQIRMDFPIRRQDRAKIIADIVRRLQCTVVYHRPGRGAKFASLADKAFPTFKS